MAKMKRSNAAHIKLAKTAKVKYATVPYMPSIQLWPMTKCPYPRLYSNLNFFPGIKEGQLVWRCMLAVNPY